MTLRYGLIGSGMTGREQFRNLTLPNGREVTAIADPNEEMRARPVEPRGGRARALADCKDMLSSGLEDARVLIAIGEAAEESARTGQETNLRGAA